ncbi:GNAT family N-acetyltransferase [Streptomyces sp. NBC_00237]|uniref:GNAT family N-acetyltransferase n=1 Tax=Streptomyces sp. NBC_00237 TaxID=2975687 RepID=UPI0022596DD8|nr:GNAT family N-acetyltransferase [Streptomyces sp. NBC_00237]MCX5201667.1 GNAT family N-acetyltransferase [Streptomyces sp. NBC_00237]
MPETHESPDTPVTPVDTVTVRAATFADDLALGALDRDTWSPLSAVTPPPEPPYGPYFDERHFPEDVLVAEEDGRLLGYVRLVPPTPLACNAHVLQINGFAVAEEARGRGIGRTLVRAACAEVLRRGGRRITLRVLCHNTPARALYEAEGFAVEGVLPQEFFLRGEYLDDVLMGRALTD